MLEYCSTLALHAGFWVCTPTWKSQLFSGFWRKQWQFFRDLLSIDVIWCRIDEYSLAWLAAWALWRTKLVPLWSCWCGSSSNLLLLESCIPLLHCCNLGHVIAFCPRICCPFRSQESRPQPFPFWNRIVWIFWFRFYLTKNKPIFPANEFGLNALGARYVNRWLCLPFYLGTLRWIQQKWNWSSKSRWLYNHDSGAITLGAVDQLSKPLYPDREDVCWL